MLELFGWDVGIGTLAAFALVGGALVIGGVAHLTGSVTLRFHWLIVGLAALVGGYVGSESLGTVSTWGYEFEGLFIVPAFLGAVVVGGVVDAIARYATQGSYAPQMRPI